MKKLFIVAFIALCASFASCESCSRGWHTIQSDFNGGLDRKVVLLNYNGDTLHVWEGKFDVSTESQTGSYYWDNNGKRVMVNPGIGIIINEEK